MADDADMAAEIAAATLARGLSRLSAALPAGVPGECDDCGEPMPRLVDGLCGFCRDRRRPPAAAYDRAAARPAPSPVSTKPKETIMPAYKDGKYISVPADGALLKRIERFAGAADLSVAAAATALIEDALADADAAPADTPNLAEIGTVALFAELKKRIDQLAEPAALQEAQARAESAEAMLAQVRAALGSVAA